MEEWEGADSCSSVVCEEGPLEDKGSFTCAEDTVDPDRLLKIGPAVLCTPVGTEKRVRGLGYEFQKRRIPLDGGVSVGSGEDVSSCSV